MKYICVNALFEINWNYTVTVPKEFSEDSSVSLCKLLIVDAPNNPIELSRPKCKFSPGLTKAICLLPSSSDHFGDYS